VVPGPCNNGGNRRIVYIVAIRRTVNHGWGKKMEQKTP
jgi:hypothetical protein